MCALAVILFIGCRRVHWGMPCASLRLSGVAGFIGVCPDGRRIHLVSLGSLVRALGVAEFIHGRWDMPWVTLCSSGVAGFIRVHPGGRRLHPGSKSSSGCAL